MGYIKFNPNPQHNLVGDCVIRAIAAATQKTWDDIYIDLCIQGFKMCDMPSSNAVWKAYLLNNGFDMHIINSSCSDCYTVKQFADEHKEGTYVLGTGNHAVAVISGNYYDSWDSGEEVLMFYFQKEIVQ